MKVAIYKQVQESSCSLHSCYLLKEPEQTANKLNPWKSTKYHKLVSNRSNWQSNLFPLGKKTKQNKTYKQHQVNPAAPISQQRSSTESALTNDPYRGTTAELGLKINQLLCLFFYAICCFLAWRNKRSQAVPFSSVAFSGSLMQRSCCGDCIGIFY